MKKIIYFFSVAALALVSCKKEKDKDAVVDLPTVTTYVVTNITTNSATCGGDATSDGGSGIIERGVVWGISPNPEYVSGGIMASSGSGMGSFTCLITGISPGNTYYVRAFARNSAGTGYGNQVMFTTPSLSAPTLTSGSYTNVTSTSAVCSSTVLTDGGTAVTSRGFCYSSTTILPTILDATTNAGGGLGAYTSTLSGLSSNTAYYVRAYATNSAGTSYGNPIVITTDPGIGDNYLGGIIAYILQPGDAGYDANNQHGIIAAPSDQSTSAPWALTLTNTGATAQAIGSGQTNTSLIVSNQGAGTYAAQLCDNLSLSGYSDWHLPSLYELEKLYLNKTVIGGFAVAFYWSSSEDNQNSAWVQSFNSNSQSSGIKTTNYNVRAVRKF